GRVSVSLRVLRSSLIAARNVVSVQAADSAARVQCLVWDSLLSRSDARADAAMIRLTDKASLDCLQWRTGNALYAGWQTLLASAAQDFTTSSLEPFRRWAKHIDATSDHMHSGTWPPALAVDFEEVPADVYATAGSEIAFAALSQTGPVGCEAGA